METLKNISLKNILIITIGGFLVAVSVYYLMVPAGFATGSLSGLVMVLSNFIPLPISTMTFIVNAILLILGFLLVGSDFCIKTIYASNLLPLFLWIFEKITPNIHAPSYNIIINAGLTILAASSGMAMLFYMNASSGGLDIVAMILSKYFPIEVGAGVALVGSLVAISGFFVYGPLSGTVGLITTFLMGHGIDFCIKIFGKIPLFQKREKLIP